MKRIYYPSNHTCPNIPNCVLEGCGNGIVERGEECDDGNTIDNDGCSSNCTFDFKK